MRKRDSAIKKVANADENRPHNRYTDIGKQTFLIKLTNNKNGITNNKNGITNNKNGITKNK